MEYDGQGMVYLATLESLDFPKLAEAFPLPNQADLTTMIGNSAKLDGYDPGKPSVRFQLVTCLTTVLRPQRYCYTTWYDALYRFSLQMQKLIVELMSWSAT